MSTRHLPRLLGAALVSLVVALSAAPTTATASKPPPRPIKQVTPPPKPPVKPTPVVKPKPQPTVQRAPVSLKKAPGTQRSRHASQWRQTNRNRGQLSRQWSKAQGKGWVEAAQRRAQQRKGTVVKDHGPTLSRAQKLMLLRSARKENKDGLKKGGQAFVKHRDRVGPKTPTGTALHFNKQAGKLAPNKPAVPLRGQRLWSQHGSTRGKPAARNLEGMKHLREIVDGPGTWKTVKRLGKSGRHSEHIEKRLGDGRGIRLNKDYSFKGFIDQ